MSTALVQLSNTLAQTDVKVGTSDASTADTQFNEVLSREIDGRKGASSENNASKTKNDANNTKNDKKVANEKGQADGENKTVKESKAAKEKKASQPQEGDSVATKDEATGSEQLTDAEQLIAFVTQLDASDTQPATDKGNSVEQYTQSVAATVDSKVAAQTLAASGEDALQVEGEEEPLLGKDALPSTDADIDEATKGNFKQALASSELAENKLLKGKFEKSGLPATSRLVKGLTLPENAAATANPLQNALAHNPNVTEVVQADGRLTPQVASSAWNQALGQQVTLMAKGDVQTASLSLNPPELGPLRINLNISNNQASANFVAAQPEVRQALEDAMPRLREMLAEAGVDLGQTNVSSGMPQQQGSENESGNAASANMSWGVEAEDAATNEATAAAPVRRQGLVDTFV